MTSKLPTLLVAGLFSTSALFAGVLYVSPAGNNSGGSSWTTAFTTIQAAIDAASANDTIVVTNGTYAPIDNEYALPVTIKSVNGAKYTIIDGGGVSRCAWLGAWLGQAGGVLDGFTLTNGFTSAEGGGVRGGTLRNCVLAGNEGYRGGGAYNSTLEGCTVTGNTAMYGGGAYECTLKYCTLIDNLAKDDGGGAQRSTLNNCTVTGNKGGSAGAGTASCALNSCIVWGNTRTTGVPNDIAGGTLSYTCSGNGGTANGCVQADPLFLDAANGDYRVNGASPCAGMGDPTVTEPWVDSYGASIYTAGRINMGAYSTCQIFYVGTWHEDDSNDGFTWRTAKRSIQAAIDAITCDQGVVNVMGGTYEPITTRNKSIIINGLGHVDYFGGAEQTIIDGGGTRRCATLLDPERVHEMDWQTNTVLNGFTLVNGLAIPEGESEAIGGGVVGGTLNNCVIADNEGEFGGGAWQAVLNDCTIRNNRTMSPEAFEAFFASPYLSSVPVAAAGAVSCILNRCIVMNNQGLSAGGLIDCSAENCLIVGNVGLFGGGTAHSTLLNCTVTDNVGWDEGYEYAVGGSFEGSAVNCIIWGNVGGDTDFVDLSYSCTGDGGTANGCIQDDPLFVNSAAGDYRLQPTSLCINTGLNDAVADIIDLAGNARVNDAAVEMGAYEYYPMDTLYVDATRPDDSGNGVTWATAKRSIQAAVDIALAGDTIIVADGVYAPISTGNKAITISSVDGAEVTTIDGGGGERCATLAGGEEELNTVLNGFTLSNGIALENGGGAYGGTLNDCILSGNKAGKEGGGAYGSVLNNCTLVGNESRYGSGACNSTLNYCTLTGNIAGIGGGGVLGGILNHCTLTDNTALRGGGASDGTVLNNCVLSGNAASRGGGVWESTLNNCTLVDNTATDYGGGAIYSTLTNCVVWNNIGTDVYSCSLAYSCSGNGGAGNGCIQADPLFVDAANGDYRLQAGSPCIDAGSNDAVVRATDLAGNPRIQGLAVDMGAYEFVPGAGGVMFSVGGETLDVALSEAFFAGASQADADSVVAALLSVTPDLNADVIGEILQNADLLGLTLAELAAGDTVLSFEPELTIARVEILFDGGVPEVVLEIELANGIDLTKDAALSRAQSTGRAVLCVFGGETPATIDTLLLKVPLGGVTDGEVSAGVGHGGTASFFKTVVVPLNQ